METSWVHYRLWYSYSFCINTKLLYNAITKDRKSILDWTGQPERKEYKISLGILGIWPSMFRKNYLRWNRHGQWWGKRTVISRLEIKRKNFNVEQTDSRKIQAKTVPTVTIKLVINQLMKRIGWYNWGDKGFEHMTLMGKSLNLISSAGGKEVKEGKELTEVAKSFCVGLHSKENREIHIFGLWRWTAVRGAQEKVLKQLDKLNCNKSLRLEPIHLKVLKEPNKIAELLNICNLSLKTATRSEIWRGASSIPDL